MIRQKKLQGVDKILKDLYQEAIIVYNSPYMIVVRIEWLNPLSPLHYKFFDAQTGNEWENTNIWRDTPADRIQRLIFDEERKIKQRYENRVVNAYHLGNNIWERILFPTTDRY